MSKGFHIVNVNIQSIRNKIDQLKYLFNNKEIDVLTLTETWLDERDKSEMYAISGFNLVRFDRLWGINKKSNLPKRGGGLCMYINRSMRYSDFVYLHRNKSTKDIEIQIVELSNMNMKDMVIINCYRPPAGNREVFCHELLEVVADINESKNCEIYVVGDMNIDIKKNKEASLLLIETMQGCGLKQWIKGVTRYSKKDSCIDLIFTNSKSVMRAGIMDVNISDHQMIYITKKKQKDCRKKVVFKGRSYKRFDEWIFREQLANHDWTLFDKENNPEKCWEYFLSVITEFMNRVCPIKEFKVRVIEEQWLHNELLEKIIDKDVLLKKAKQTKKAEDIARARNARNKVNTEIRRTKKDYLIRKIDANIKDSKKFWKNVSEVLPKGNKKHKEINLKDAKTNVEIESNKLPNYINNYFTNIGYELAKHMDKNWEFKGNECNDILRNMETTTEEVTKLCQNIDTSKPSGLENLSSRVMKIALLAQTQRFTNLLNRIIDSEVIPQSWKEGIIIPIPKGGDPTAVNNLRPVTLLPIQGKILEKIIHKRLMNHMDINQILSNNQGGYRKDHSTIDTISRLTDDILMARNNGEFTFAVYIDLKKAFDTVNHNILMSKLGKYGIFGKTKSLITNYLTGRTQKTKVNGNISDESKITCGVPQGSVLGPLLFLVYVNDVENVIQNSKIHLYADDTVIYISGKDSNGMQRLLQEDLDKFADWSTTNKLSVNTAKTKLMAFSPKTNKTKCKNVRLILNGESLQQVNNYKYLGITLDPDLNYETFIKQQIKNVSYKSYILTRISGYLSTKALLKVYKAYEPKSQFTPSYGDLLSRSSSFREKYSRPVIFFVKDRERQKLIGVSSFILVIHYFLRIGNPKGLKIAVFACHAPTLLYYNLLFKGIYLNMAYYCLYS